LKSKTDGGIRQKQTFYEKKSIKIKLNPAREENRKTSKTIKL